MSSETKGKNDQCFCINCRFSDEHVDYLQCGACERVIYHRPDCKKKVKYTVLTFKNGTYVRCEQCTALDMAFDQ